MQHIYVNFKRFDVPREFGGVNGCSDPASYAEEIIRKVETKLSSYKDASFTMFFPESLLISAVSSLKEKKNLSIGSQGVYRTDVTKGGNFGALTTNRPASIVKALGCDATLIGHCEERNDKNELLKLGGNKDRTLVNRILNQEVRAAESRALKVLYCTGEKEEELDEWDKVIAEQLEIGLEGAALKNVVIAYEPVWSIGPGKRAASKPYITKVAKLIKSVLGDVPVVYGGGLKKDNAAMLASIDEISGGLIALTRFAGDIGFYPEEYLEIVDLYMKEKGEKA